MIEIVEELYISFIDWSLKLDVDLLYVTEQVIKFLSYTSSNVLSAVRTGLEGPGLTAAQKLWYCIATVGGQYIWTRLQSFSAFRRWGDSEQVPFFSAMSFC